MRTLQNIAQDVADRCRTRFQTVRLSSVQSSPQLLNELRAMNDSLLPAVVVIMDSGQLTEFCRRQEVKITLVLVDRFVAGSDERTLSGLTQLQRLMDLFPAVATPMNNVQYCPASFYVATADPKYICWAFELQAIQPTD